MGSLKRNVYLLTLGDVRRSLQKTNAPGFTKGIKAARERKVIIMFLSPVLVLCERGVAEFVFVRLACVSCPTSRVTNGSTCPGEGEREEEREKEKDVRI